MFVQNQIRDDLKNHSETIVDALKASGEVCLAVAYVRENGVDVILEHLKGKCTKLLCSFDMGITQISGIKKLLENKVDVRVYKTNDGTFHPKIWLFKGGDNWTALIGSANLTRAALMSNVEASVLLNDNNITTSAVMFFNYLWDSDSTEEITTEEVEYLWQQIENRKSFGKEKVNGTLPSSAETQHERQVMLEFVKSWIDIAKWEKKGVSSLWRGWYIIPDQGYVDDELIKKLHSYVSFIGSDGIHLDATTSQKYEKFLILFEKSSNFKREILNTSLHALFVRQAKNYLIKFGWAHHPLEKKRSGEIHTNKNVLYLSDMGMRVGACQNVAEIKEVYSEYFDEFSFNGLNLVKFTRKLLNKLEYLDLNEFNYFVVHAYSDDDLDIIINLILMYRRFSDKRAFDNEVKKYFGGAKDLTASNVYGNHTEKVKYTMSAIGWCSGFDFSADKFILKLYNDKN